MIEALLVPKQEIFYLDETANCQDAVRLLEEHSQRNVPVLDTSSNLYRGNIYRYHIYKHKFHHPDANLADLSVTHFLKNTTKTVHINETIYHLLFKIKDLPYIAVLDEGNAFMGVIYHDSMTHFMQQTSNIQDTGYILAIKSDDYATDVIKISRIIRRYCDILAVNTLAENDYWEQPAVLFSLPSYLELPQINRMKELLNRRRYTYEIYEI